MKNNRFLFTVLSLLCFAASSVYAQDPTIAVGNDSGDPGDPVSVATTWDTGGGSYLGVGYEIDFDDTVLAFTGCVLNEPYASYMLAVCQLKAGSTDIVEIGLIDNLLGPGPVPTGTLATLSFAIDGGATPGTSTPLGLDPGFVDLGEGLGQTPTTLADGFVDINVPPQPGYVSTPPPFGPPLIMGGVTGDPADSSQVVVIENSGEPDSTLNVDCDVIGDPGIFSIDNDAPFQIVGGIDPPVPVTVTCDLNNPPSQYAGDLVCTHDGNEQLGESPPEAVYPLTCNIAEAPAVLTVIKIVENGTTGGTLGVGDFTLQIDGGPVTSGVPNDVAPGVPHIVSEIPEPGYIGVIGGDCNSETGEIILEPAQSATCTITNTAQQATLTVVKVVENGDTGATAVVADFDIQVDSGSVTSGAANDVNPGLHVVSEIPVPGYDGVISGDCDPTTGEVTLALGEEKTCTITNTAQQATLTVIKVVENGPTPGPLDVADFDLFIDADQVTSGVANDRNPGTYTVSETPEDGYTGVISGDCDPTTGEVTLGVGDNATCTITNTRDAFALTVTKVMDPPEFMDLFIMDANGVQGTPASNGATSTAQVLYGDDAYIDELAGMGTNLDFWTSTYECLDVAGAPIGDGDGHRYDFTMPASDIDCTITNVRKMEEVTLVKETTDSSDGEFCFDAIAYGNPVEGPCIETSGGYGRFIESGYVGHYQLNEIIDGPFALISANCSNGQNPETGFDLVPGEPLTCTWVNGPAFSIPVNNSWALLLLALMVLGAGWYYRPVIMRRH